LHAQKLIEKELYAAGVDLEPVLFDRMVSQPLAGFGGSLVARGGACAFRSFLDPFNRNRGKRAGTQVALIVLRIAQMRILLEQGSRSHVGTIWNLGR
jgi:hypothetical protein